MCQRKELHSGRWSSDGGEDGIPVSSRRVIHSKTAETNDKSRPGPAWQERVRICQEYRRVKRWQKIYRVTLWKMLLVGLLIKAPFKPQMSKTSEKDPVAKSASKTWLSITWHCTWCTTKLPFPLPHNSRQTLYPGAGLCTCTHKDVMLYVVFWSLTWQRHGREFSQRHYVNP